MARRAGRQKERILRTAAELFAQNGYHGTGIQELSDAVGLGRGALYHHIGSKQDLLYDISVLHVDTMVRIGEEILGADLPASDKLRALSQALMRNIAENRAEWTVFFREIHSLSGENRTATFARRGRFEQIWAAIYEEGVRTGEFRPLDPIVLKGMLGMHNYAYVWLRGTGRLSPDAIADVFVDVLRRGVLSDAALTALHHNDGTGLP